MTRQRMVELLEIEKECARRNACGECNRSCHICDLLQDDTELHEMYEEVIALVKAQEPRVMTFEEVMSDDTEIAWTEAEFEDDEYAWFCPGIIIHRENAFESNAIGVSFEGDRDNYGKEIRCWTSKPTKEQREAVPWA